MFPEPENYPHSIDSETAEYAAVIKTICDNYDIKQEDICQFRAIHEIADAIGEDTAEVKKIKTVPVHLILPPQLAPQGGSNFLQLHIRPTPDFERRGSLGLHEYQLIMLDYKIRFWYWAGNREYYPLGAYMLFVEKKDLKPFYRCILTLQNQSEEEVQMPILPGKMLNEIYTNSIGFLQRGKEHREKYTMHHIPYKRGILLSGEPGSGKTMSCKWLKQLCIEEGFSYRVVTPEDYRSAQQRGHVRTLFRLPESNPGILFFDDMDIFVKNRADMESEELRLFLTHLDGIVPANGAVFVFTTNYVKELDPAFVRPGRIDLKLTFKKPSKTLRKRFIETLFHKDILSQIDISDTIEKSDGYTYAELEEIRKLMALDLIDEKKINMTKTFETFALHRKEFEEEAKLGFGHNITETDSYYGDEITAWELPIPKNPF